MSFKFAVFMCVIAFTSVSSCGEKMDVFEEKIYDFQSCLSKQHEKVNGKICGVFVPWGDDISDLVDCLNNYKVVEKENIKDKDGDVFRINFVVNCKSERQLSIQFEKSEITGEFLINFVGEIVN